MSGYRTIPIPRVSRSFWKLNDEMHSPYSVTFVREIDARPLQRCRERVSCGPGVKPSYTALVVAAAAIVLKENPAANRAILGPPLFRRMIQFEGVDITVAVERDVPGNESVVLAETIRNADRKSLGELTESLRGFAGATEESNERWRLFSTILGRLPAWIAGWLIRMPRYLPSQWVAHRGGACFVNSPAKYGVDLFVGDMLWPLTISFGWVRERPFVEGGRVTACPTMPLIMIFDRRIMAGAPAARLFARLAEILEQADELLS